jgi:hypothetical protein
MRCGDVLGGNDVAGVEVTDNGVVNAGTGADVVGAGEFEPLKKLMAVDTSTA